MSKKKKPSQRAKILAMFNQRCAYCGCMLDDENATIDHIIPRAKGGTNCYENLFPACGKCNWMKTDMSIEEFRKFIIKKINAVFPIGLECVEFYYESVTNPQAVYYPMFFN